MRYLRVRGGARTYLTSISYFVPSPSGSIVYLQNTGQRLVVPSFLA